MDYKEFSSHLGSEGQLDIGDKVWICDYRFNDIHEKPIRHVPPQEVVIVSNEDLPKNKKVYYSTVHFRPIGKKGNTLSRIIAPYDNTGYRSYTGVSLNIFLNREDCVEYYIKQCEDIKSSINKEKVSVQEKFDKMLNDIDEEIDGVSK